MHTATTNPVTEAVDRVSPVESRLAPAPAEGLAPAPEADQPPKLPTLAETLEHVRITLGWTGTLRHSTDPQAKPYLGWGNKHALNVATLWAAHANARVTCDDTEHKHAPGIPGPMVWPATPRLGLFAPREGSGKSYLAERILDFVPLPSLQDDPTGPGMVRLIGLRHATVALDEGDIFFGSGNSRKQMAISVLNNGYRPNGSSIHAEGSRDTFEVPTFGPVIVAALDKIETGTAGKLRALLSRFIVLRLDQAPSGYRPPRLRRSDKENIENIAEYMQVLMMAAAPSLAVMEAEMPGYMGPRTAEIWEPLFLIAAFADATGDITKEGDNLVFQRLDHEEIKPLWMTRILEAAYWYCGGGEQEAILRAGLDKARSATALWASQMAV